MRHLGWSARILSVIAIVACCAGQERAQPVVAGQDAPHKTLEPGAQAISQPMEDKVTPSDYILGPEDKVELFSQDLGDISGKPLAIGMSGYLDLPLAGRVHATGLTVQQLQDAINSALRPYVREPSVIVTVTEFHSQPVSVLGAVGLPGVHQLEGRKTLVEMLSLAGGIRTDAGNSVAITRSLEWGRLPLPTAKDDVSGKYSVAEVRLDSIMSGKRPDENILVRPHDVISVPKARLVYVVGEVPKAGGFVLEGRESMSVLQALSLAGGVNPQSAPQNSKILRGGPDPQKRTEIPVNLKKIIAGKQEDIAMKSDDILFVPSSTSKKAAAKAAEAALQTLTGVVIWRGGHL